MIYAAWLRRMQRARNISQTRRWQRIARGYQRTLETRVNAGRVMVDDETFYGQARYILGLIRRPVAFGYHVAVGTLVTLALLVVVWGALQIHNRRIPVANVEATLLTPTAAPLGRIGVHYELDRLEVCAVDIQTSIIDGAGELRPLVTLHRDVAGPTGHDRFSRSWQIPQEAAPGPALLRVGWSYTCPGNYTEALSPLPLALPDLPFTIVSPR